MYTNVTVSKPTGISPGSAAAKNPNVTLVDAEDILFFPPRDSKGVKMVGNFAMKEGARMIQVYMTSSKISAPYESDGDEDSVNIKQMFEGQYPGNKLEGREFIQNWLGRNVIIIHGTCADTVKTVVGTPCAPLQLKPAGQDNKDGRFHTLKFEAFNTSQFLPGHYEGSLVLDVPVEVAAVDAVALSSANSQYKLPSLAVTDAVEFDAFELEHGTIVTLIGGGGAAPATLPEGVAGSATVILADGTTWTGLSNSVLHLQVFLAGATTYLIEQARA